MITEWIKQGVMGDLHPIAQKGLGRVVRLYERYGYHNFYVTSIRESNHMPGALHYIGRALDFKQQRLSTEAIERELGPDWDVVEYSEKGVVHVEYDPKKEDM